MRDENEPRALTERAKKIQQSFLDALGRLQSGCPKHEDLATRAAAGKLRINFSTVAMEAGHSRTLIAFSDCAYPDVRTAVLDACEQYGARRGTVKETMRELREEISSLNDKLDLRDTAYAELVIRTEAYEKGVLVPREQRQKPKGGRPSNTRIVASDKLPKKKS
jgi:hypothetical protein